MYLRCDVQKVVKAGLHPTRFVGKILYSKLVEHKNSSLIFYFAPPF